jgi:mesencephalic astrocyte-derived neurotrophic factor
LFLKVKNAVKVEAEASNEDIKKLRVKQLKSILSDRGVECDGCIEKEDFVKRVLETAHMDL